MACKLFLGGVSPNTTGEAIQAHFSKYGTVTDAVVMRDRGFGFVTFETQEGAEAALAQPQQTIGGQTIDVKHAVGKGGGRSGGGPATDKVFVGGLPQDCSDDKIRDYFQAYGNIVDAVVMKDRETGRSRGFGFVQFDASAPVEKVMQDYATHKIEGKWVEVKRSVPRDQMPPAPASRSEGGRGDGGRSGGGSGGGGGGSGPPSKGGPSAYGGYGYDMPPAYGGAYVGGGAYGGGYGAYGGGYGGAYGYPGYPSACGGYPGACGGYSSYPGGYSMPPPSGYGAYGMDPYGGAYGGYAPPPGDSNRAPPPTYGAPPAGKGSRSSPY